MLSLTQVAFPAVLVNRFSETLPRVLRSYHPRNRVLIGFSTQSGPSWFAGTDEMPPSALMRFGEADSSFQRSTGWIRFATMSLPIEDMEAVGATVGGSDLSPPRHSVIVTPDPTAMARLQKLHAMAGDLAEHAPEVIAVPQAARSLEQALVCAMADCLVAPDGEGRETGSRHRDAVMKRFYTVLETHPDGVLLTLDVCKAVGVSNRTLNVCCNETLGMSPHRFLKLRQMHLVRRALRLADPTATTVTVIATDHGFWDLGRFAGAYRQLFEELPSKTLRRGAEALPMVGEYDNLMLGSGIT
jgi:AraC-like DNA-binding protein